ncbi:ribonuclease P protein subunit rpr2-like [Tribolium madens]|uniref:ribonuclease P protein subunit rpr2-like n=1 Tax=Tribolium madens TaxID=41895 RepID=UPI001CF7484F|nr:ribonuclease P protein subunit rpr2-like [Tribolium madens]XP_044264924.1 ribonuclease P protein subunit rpr2-like [Tribolium madens]XP_044264925.1 ribonuclease P protein subunit rpr2-like [Tribolium madens]
MESTNNSTKIKKCAGKDNLQRLNYLYQACNAITTENETNHLASVMYSNLLVAISKKAVQRMDIEVKRTICKGCRCMLLAGITCKVRIKKKHSIWTCTKCNTAKVFPAQNPDYVPWNLQDDSVVETLQYK